MGPLKNTSCFTFIKRDLYKLVLCLSRKPQIHNMRSLQNKQQAETFTDYCTGWEENAKLYCERVKLLQDQS